MISQIVPQFSDKASKQSFGQENADQEVEALKNKNLKILNLEKQEALIKNKENLLSKHLEELKQESLKEIGNTIESHQLQVLLAENEISDQNENRRSKNTNNQNKKPEQTKLPVQEKVDQNINLKRPNSSKAQQIPKTQDTSKTPASNKKKQTPVVKSKVAPPGKASHQNAFIEYEKRQYGYYQGPPSPPNQYQPIIINKEKASKYDKLMGNSQTVSMQTDLVFEDADEMLNNFQEIFENQNGRAVAAQAKIKSRVRDLRDDEIALLIEQFQNIPKDETEEESAQFDDVKDWLLEYPEFMIRYNIDGDNLQTYFEKLRTRIPQLLTRDQFLDFMFDPRPAVNSETKNFDHLKRVRQLKGENQPVEFESLIEEQDLRMIHKAFLQIDTFGENMIPVKKIFHQIEKSPDIQKILDQPAVYVPSIQKTITLRRILYEYQLWSLHCEKNERETREYTSIEQIFDFLENYQRLQFPTRDRIIHELLLLGQIHSSQLLEVSRDFINLLKRVYQDIPKRAIAFVKTDEYIEELKSSKAFSRHENELVREHDHDDIKQETVLQTIDRMGQQADTYVQIDEIIEFFTVRGRPDALSRFIKNENIKEKRDQSFKKYSSQPKRVIPKEDDQSNQPRQNEIDQQKQGEENQLNQDDERSLMEFLQREGEVSTDSDEEGAQINEKIQKRKEEKILGKRAQKHNGKNGKGGSQVEDLDPQLKKVMEKRGDMQLTVPQGFTFIDQYQNRQETIRQTKLKQTLEQKQKEEDQIVAQASAYRASQIPKHIEERDRWAQIQKEQEDRRQEVRDKSKILTKMNEKPFQFYLRDQDKENNQPQENPAQENQQHFKAVRCPWYVQVALFNRMNENQKQKSEMNQMRRKRELEEMSKLPSGIKQMMERLKAQEQQKKQREEAQNREDLNQDHPRARPIPNFQALQKQFADQLNERKQQFKSKKLAVKPFNFQEPKKVTQRPYLDQQNENARQTKQAPTKAARLEALQKFRNHVVEYQPPSTQKFDSLINFRRMEEMKKRDEQEEQQIQQFERLKRKQQLAEYIKKNVVMKDSRAQLQQRRQQFFIQQKMEAQQRQQQYIQEMNRIMHNVLERPFLFQGAHLYQMHNPNSGNGQQQLYENYEEFMDPEQLEQMMMQHQMQQQMQQQGMQNPHNYHPNMGNRQIGENGYPFEGTQSMQEVDEEQENQTESNHPNSNGPFSNKNNKQNPNSESNRLTSSNQNTAHFNNPMMNSNQTFQQRPSTGVRPQSGKQEVQSTLQSSAKNDENIGEEPFEEQEDDEEEEQVEYVNEEDDYQNHGEAVGIRVPQNQYMQGGQDAEEAVLDGEDPEGPQDYYEGEGADLDLQRFEGHELDPDLVMGVQYKEFMEQQAQRMMENNKGNRQPQHAGEDQQDQYQEGYDPEGEQDPEYENDQYEEGEEYEIDPEMLDPEQLQRYEQEQAIRAMQMQQAHEMQYYQNYDEDDYMNRDQDEGEEEENQEFENDQRHNSF